MIYVIENQSVLDVAIQEDGSVMAAFEWALKNGLSITDDLAPGQKLSVPISSFRNADVANYFKGRKQNIATGVATGVNAQPSAGIGAMRIGNNFIAR